MLRQTLAGIQFHDDHKKRRQPLVKYFSKASITKLEDIIEQTAQRLCSTLLSRAGSRKPVHIGDAVGCFGLDVVLLYCFAREEGTLHQNDYNFDIGHALDGSLNVLPVGREWPWVIDALQSMPHFVIKKFSPGLVRYLEFFAGLRKEISDMVVMYTRGDTKSFEGRRGFCLICLRNTRKVSPTPLKP